VVVISFPIIVLCIFISLLFVTVGIILLFLGFFFLCWFDFGSLFEWIYFVILYMQPLLSSMSVGDCTVHRLRKNSFLTGAQDSHLQTVTIPGAVYIQLRRRPPEDEQANDRNK
jgi:uncharacterized RDD family membrane protein YckC